MKSIFFFLLFFCCKTLHAQQRIQFIVTADSAALTAATLHWKETGKTFTADSLGLITIDNIGDGMQTFVVSHVGFQEKEVVLQFPIPLPAVVTIVMEAEEQEEEEEVIISTTRTSRTISNTPTRIEVISGEELEEKGNMKPGDIRMLLNESTGIQTQQTSATSYNSGIRIQGLDGRYTQLLRDGFPLYAGFSGGLSIMQVSPLDLKQVEVVKGSASTLYGGGAIAGLVNLISKLPQREREVSFMANATSANGLDLSGFYSKRGNKAGISVFASRNANGAFDPAGIGLTAIPKFERYSINPRIFFYGEKTNANFSVNYTTEDRIGGSVDYIKNGGSGYFEDNKTHRITSQAAITQLLKTGTNLQFKNSVSRLNRSITVPDYLFKGVQTSSFSELSLNMQKTAMQWIAGANLLTDQFEERSPVTTKRDYSYTTVGAFVQNSWTASKLFTLETGLRGDYTSPFGFVLLPRIAALLKFSPQLSARVGGGAGYKNPTIFNEDAERIQFRNILPINEATAQNERSVGGNVDVNYRTNFKEVAISINHLFYYTRVNQPLTLTTTLQGPAFLNALGNINTKGMETNLKLSYSDFKLFVGYTYTDAVSVLNGRRKILPLTARHRLNNVLMFEKEEKLKIGLEAYYFSAQQLSTGTMGKSYWIMGLMAEKLFEKFSVFINFENFTDTRQTKFGSIYSGPVNAPQFADIYAPVDGFVVNGGLKLKL